MLVLFNHLIRFAIDTSLIAVKFSTEARERERDTEEIVFTSIIQTVSYSRSLHSISRVNLLDLCALFTFCLSMVYAYCRRKNESSHLKHLPMPTLVRGKYSVLGSS